MNSLKKILMLLTLICFTGMMMAQSDAERQANNLVAEGDEAYNAKNFTQAISKYQEALTLYNNAKSASTPFTEELKSLYFKLYGAGAGAQNFQLATQYGEEYLKLDERNIDVVDNMAKIYRVGLRDIPKAIAVWQRYDEKYPNFRAKQAIGDIYAGNKDYTNAIVWYQRAFEMTPDAALLGKLAKAYIDNKQPQNAVQAYSDFIATNPSRRELGITYKNMGVLYTELRDIPKAIENYENALEINWDRQIALWLATEYEKRKDHTNALKYLEMMLSRNNRDNDAIYWKGVNLYNLGRNAEAKTEFNKLRSHAQYGASANEYIKNIDGN